MSNSIAYKGEGVYLVRSDSTDKIYRVIPDIQICSCPHATMKKSVICKHMKYVEKFREESNVVVKCADITLVTPISGGVFVVV